MTGSKAAIPVGRWWYREDLLRRITALTEALAIFDQLHPEIARLANDRAAALPGPPIVIGDLRALSEPAGRIPLLEDENPAPTGGNNPPVSADLNPPAPLLGKKGRRRWTLPGSLGSGVHDEIIKRMWAAGDGLKEIAEAVRPEKPYSTQAISTRVAQLGLERRGRGAHTHQQRIAKLAAAVPRTKYPRPGGKKATHLARPIPEKIVAEHRFSSASEPGPVLSRDELRFQHPVLRRCQRCPGTFTTTLVNKLFCDPCIATSRHIHQPE